MKFKGAEQQWLYDEGYIDGYRQAVYDLLTNDDDNEGECKAEDEPTYQRGC